MNAARYAEGRSLRIMHVFRAPLGGLFRHVIDLAGEQIARGHEVGLFFDSEMRTEQAERALARIGDGLALGARGCPIKRNPSLRDASALARFMATLRETQPDIVHGHGSKGGAYARLPGFFAGGGPIRAYTPHGGSFNYRPGSPVHRLYMAAEKLLSLTTDVFLFESAYIAGRYDRYVGGDRGLRRIVTNGIGAAEFQPVSPAPDAADLLYIGELRAAKGIDTLFDAIARAGKEFGQSLTVNLVGTGPDKDMLLDYAQRLGVAAQIAFLGPLAARDAFRRGRVMVVPSRAESFPYVVLEAAGARVPMVATNVGGIPEIFGPYKNRLGPCDDPTGLCDRILAMRRLDETERQAQCGELAAYVSANFSIKTMVDAVMDGYREALAIRAGGTQSSAPAKIASTM